MQDCQPDGARTISVTSSQNAKASEQGPDNLSGLRILVVEDSWHAGVALKNLLRALGAEVLGPVATAADAERLISGPRPHVGIVDFNLRGGELAVDLIDKLNEHGICVIVISAYASVPLAPGTAMAVLQKPVIESQLLAVLRPLAAQKSVQ
jgi:DNA-binding NtrC family response regulator